MMTIVIEFGKFRYNRLPMGMCASGDIFQANAYELLGDIEFIKKYTDGILILSTDSFKNHIEQMRIIFGILCTVGLKVNATKFSFWFKEIPYPGYVITREGIKPNPNTVQGDCVYWATSHYY